MNFGILSKRIESFVLNGSGFFSYAKLSAVFFILFNLALVVK